LSKVKKNMSRPLNLNELIRLRVALEGQDDDTDVVVRCVLRNAVGTAIGSTLTLTHLGDGVFGNDTVIMPDTPLVSARYYIFEGDGTTPHPDFFGSLELFYRSTGSGACSGAQKLVGIIGSDDLVGVIKVC
jgi:hypothetical protein